MELEKAEENISMLVTAISMMENGNKTSDMVLAK
jgi:hypothetical protein